jgi:hypothetical protein
MTASICRNQLVTWFQLAPFWSTNPVAVSKRPEFRPPRRWTTAAAVSAVCGIRWPTSLGASDARASRRSVACAGGRTIANLSDLDLHRHPHLDLLTRAWKLRENVTPYDAMYLALAEALDAPLVTCDRALASTSRHRATIEAIA